MEQQDGPSLDSSLYLNVSLRYLGPWDTGTPRPWNPWTLGLLDLLPPPLKLWGGWVEPRDLLLPSTLSSSNLLPPPSYSSQVLHLPPKPPPNSSQMVSDD